MEETKSQECSEKIKEYESLSKKVCRLHLYDTFRVILCMAAIIACIKPALFTYSDKKRAATLGTVAGVGILNVGVKHRLNKKKQKIDEQKTQLLKEYFQLSKA